ncbi:MAG TPA: NapC/NirT family cytochrome c [Candidatus Eisenbacteria bacterium]|nr:NapC/NirT family cytochrome c [Candidatus Eisenbacteria bacterium]
MDTPASASLIGRIRDFLFRPSSLSLVAVVAVGMLSGLVFWGGFNTGMEATNSLEFCNSCHEMRDTVFQEYKETVHYQNRSGVRAICSDCHVPRDWVHKFVRKVGASQELYVKFVSGAIDTPEKFEKNRIHLAQRVWKTMKENDSHECRNCHSWEAMHLEKQSPRARAEMEKGRKEGKTCIDCHKGIAHLLPKEFKEDD